MKKYDENANKILDFAAKTVFTVYTRRSNCHKKIIYTGMDINKALEVFHGFKVFSKDYKYLTYHESGVDHIIYRTVGEGKRLSYQGKREGVNYNRKRVRFETIPTSLWDSFAKSLTGINITPSKALPMILAHFCASSDADRLKIIESSTKEVLRHVMLSGGDNSKAVRDYLIESAKEDELL